MALFKFFKSADDSEAKLALIEATQTELKVLAEDLIYTVENIEVPTRNSTISALSDAIRLEQDQITASFMRVQKAKSILGAA